MIYLRICHFLHSLPTRTSVSTEVSLSQKWTLMGIGCPWPSSTAQMRKRNRLGDLTEQSCHLIINPQTYRWFDDFYNISLLWGTKHLEGAKLKISGTKSC